MKGERVVGAGKGPVRQLDVVSEVSIVFAMNIRNFIMINKSSPFKRRKERMLCI